MFSEWLGEQDNWRQRVNTFFQKVKAQVLSSMQVNDGYVAFRFPQDYEKLYGVEQPTLQLPQQQQSYTPQPMTIAAHTITPGKLIETHMDKRAGKWGKGGLAYDSIKPQLGHWTPKQADVFRGTLQKRLGSIGKEMGLLFEIDIYICLLDDMRMNSREENQDSFWSYSVRDRYAADLQGKVSKTAGPLILEFIEIHAKDMAEKMVQKASKLLKCSVDTVQFKGGEGWHQAQQPSDMIIGCGEKMVGFNLKFTSEPGRLSIANLSFDSAYSLLGGKDLTTFQQGKSDINFVLNQLWQLSQQYKDKPQKFTGLLNYLLQGNENMPVIPAPRNYVRNRGNPEWSGAFQSDFIIKGNLLYPKDGATVIVQESQPRTYVQIKYKVKGGTLSGTSLFFEPKAGQGRVNVTVNNLASQGGRGY